MIKLIKENRKTPILKPPIFGCLRGTPAINITRGCIHSCVYCYARGFRDAPPRGEVHLYENLPDMLERELERKKRLPSWVSFSTASDPFQDVDEILKVTYNVMRPLLERGIGISFLTKGFIPDRFIGLFKDHPHLIKARIGIVSLNEGYIRLFEPFSAHPLKRLTNLRNLIDAGVDTAVRIDPLVPGFGDSIDSMEHLIKRLKVIGVKDTSVSSLIMRPSIMGQFKEELPLRIYRDIMMPYRDEPWQRVITSATTKLLPKEMRIAIYNRIKKIAGWYGINTAICGCKNPDLPWEFCSPWISEDGTTDNRQLSLFV